MKIDIKSEKHLADLHTPVELYLKLRETFPNSLLLESSDADSPQNSCSVLCLSPISQFVAHGNKASITYPDGKKEIKDISYPELTSVFSEFKRQFAFSGETPDFCGFFGFVSWDAIPYFENIKFSSTGNGATLPSLHLAFYQLLVIFDHYHDEMRIVEFLPENKASQIEKLKHLIKEGKIDSTFFDADESVSSNISDEEYIKAVARGKEACFRGDVFQIVPSRQFQRKYEGDDFNLYRSLRVINPSPYLFYFDYGDYRVMGSSPEAQLVIEKNEAYIDPIAGTFKRTHDPEKDARLAEQLKADPKETAEHIMLVDLARNDLSKNSDHVKVKNFKQIHYFSHVLHMVSRVTAKLNGKKDNLKIFGDAFPAGTLSGAPKYRAMELIDEIENQNRGIYGGALGYFGFDGDVNTAIVIRTFVSQDNVLYTQAGAGVVSESVEEKELAEVNNKLGALDKAVDMARQMNRINKKKVK